MIKNRLRFAGVGIMGSILALVLILVPVPSHAKEKAKDAGSIAELEKKMVAKSTKRLQFQKGKIHSTSHTVWKKGKKIKKSEKSLLIQKKGWYTLCVTTTSGKKKLTHLYFEKKKYEITINQTVHKQAGYYYIASQEKKELVIEAKNSSMSQNSLVSLCKRGDYACRMWKAESAGGKKIRLKNVNSGLYLSYQKATNRLVQNKYNKKNNNQIFSLYQGSGGSTYVKCLGANTFVGTEGETLTLGTRKRNSKWRFTWKKTEKPAPAASVSGATYPARLLLGHAFSLKGTIISRYSISYFNVFIYDKTGKAVLQKRCKGTNCFGSISDADAAITFGRLKEGIYCYQVAVRDVTGTAICLISRQFTVGALTGGSNMMLSFDAAKIAAVGHQSSGTALEKKACASYALAYCNAIMTGTVTNPHNYWSSSTNVDCVWSKGGYTTKSYASEAAVLQAAYNELMAGKPSILHVTGNTPQHWITIIGCKKTGSGTAILASDLQALDPWNGKVITVSDKYKVKTSYRLGIKS